MKKYLFSALLISLPAALMAQGAINAYQASQSELRGTARFLSMAGAFGALGGDLSTLTQNPAGIGVYRSSEVGATLDIDFQRSSMASQGYSLMSTQTKASCNNFGYVGSFNTGSEVMPYFNWGVTFNRIASFDRTYRGYIPNLNTSWTNYVASFTDGVNYSDLEGTSTYDPFTDSNYSWNSLLAYNSYLLNPTSDNTYAGLWQEYGSTGDATAYVRQHGYSDEYSINFGGNLMNTVYWGIGFGITDLDMTTETYYDESIQNARIPNASDDGSQTGSARWGIENYERVSGSGFNLKLGLIFKPINEFRFGLAVHTPTWYNLDYSTNAWMDYDLTGTDSDGDYSYTEADNEFSYSGQAYWERKLRTPWRLMASAAGVIGGQFIVSADYEYTAYPDMKFSDSWGEFTDITSDIKRYYQGSHTLRLGAEYRITPSWSVRAGYSFQSAPSKLEARDGVDYVYTTGTQSMYEFRNNRNYLTCGVGYRSGGFYIDAAFVHSTQKSSWSAFSPFPATSTYGSLYDYSIPAGAPETPRATVTDTHNRLVLSMGFKF
jgi:hypothetical protein